METGSMALEMGVFVDANGLLYLRARYMDAQTGSFMSKDPVMGVPGFSQTFNPYIYTRNNPTNLTDPSGEFGFLPLLGLAFLAGFALDYVLQAYSNRMDCGMSVLDAFHPDNIDLWQSFRTGVGFAMFASLFAPTGLFASLSGVPLAGAQIGGGISGAAYLFSKGLANALQGKNIRDGMEFYDFASNVFFGSMLGAISGFFEAHVFGTTMQGIYRFKTIEDVLISIGTAGWHIPFHATIGMGVTGTQYFVDFAAHADTASSQTGEEIMITSAAYYGAGFMNGTAVFSAGFGAAVTFVGVSFFNFISSF